MVIVPSGIDESTIKKHRNGSGSGLEGMAIVPRSIDGSRIKKQINGSGRGLNKMVMVPRGIDGSNIKKHIDMAVVEYKRRWRWYKEALTGVTSRQKYEE